MRKIFLIFLLLILGCEDKKIDENPCKDLNETLKYNNVEFELALAGTEFQDAPHGFLKIINNHYCTISIQERTMRGPIYSNGNTYIPPNPEYQGFIESSILDGSGIIVIPPGCSAIIKYPNTFDENGEEFYTHFQDRAVWNYYIDIKKVDCSDGNVSNIGSIMNLDEKTWYVGGENSSN
jgi:hypothetical protein